MSPRDGICQRCHKPRYVVYPGDSIFWYCQCHRVQHRSPEDTLELDLFLTGERA